MLIISYTLPSLREHGSTERNERGVAREVERQGGRRPPPEPRSGDPTRRAAPHPTTCRGGWSRVW